MEQPSSIFTLPAIVLEKVRLSEIIDLLRKRVNKFYMPSATGEVVANSKPEYVARENAQFPDFPEISLWDQTGYFCFDTYEFLNKEKTVFFNLLIGGFQIVINLQTEQAIIRLIKDSQEIGEKGFVEWKNDPDQAIPLVHSELKEMIDIYG